MVVWQSISIFSKALDVLLLSKNQMGPKSPVVLYSFRIHLQSTASGVCQVEVSWNEPREMDARRVINRLNLQLTSTTASKRHRVTSLCKSLRT